MNTGLGSEIQDYNIYNNNYEKNIFLGYNNVFKDENVGWQWQWTN